MRDDIIKASHERKEMIMSAIYPVLGNQVRLPFYLTGIGISECEYHVQRESGLVSHQFLYTKSGIGRVNIDGKSFVMKSGSMLYLSPGVPHEYYPEKDEWETCWFVFRGDHLSQIMRELGFDSYMICCGTDTTICERIFSQLMTAVSDPVSGSEKCSRLIYDFILCAAKLFGGESNPEKTMENKLESVIRYIEQNFNRDITLDELANASSLTPQYLCRVFKKKIGMRPLEYIARRRISEAKLMLDSSNKSISEIGEAVGYPDPTYFGIVFKKYEGISPSRYREIKNTLAI